MTGFNHGMTGAVIALTVKQPALAVPLAFLSHFATDMIPHFGLDEKQLFKRRFNVILVADFLFAITLMAILAILFPEHIWLIWVCMIAAASPDLMWAYHRLYIEHHKKRPKKLGRIARFHSKIQWSQTIPGFLIEAIWFVLMGTIVLYKLV
jgi:hypothetical protein